MFTAHKRLRVSLTALIFGLLFFAVNAILGQNAATVSVGSNDQLGSFLVASDGMTLYIFTNDQPGVSNCNAGCVESWPAYTLDSGAAITAAAGIGGTLGTITRGDGSTQITFNNQPLYFFITDTAPGETNGQAAGDVWFVVPVEILQPVQTEDVNVADPVATEETVVEPVATPIPVEIPDNIAVDSDLIGVGSSSDLGLFLTDNNGNTLYLFTTDLPGESACVARCAETWPPMLADSADGFPVFVESVSGVLDVIQRDGGLQVTFNGQPLYYYIGDQQPGDTTGQGVGGVWYVVPLQILHARTNAALGNILVNAEGKTLYTFANDTTGVSNCAGDCATTWPPLTVASADALPAIDSSVPGEFSVISRSDGSFQVAHDGRPLYTFAKDVNPGDTNGNGAGSVWFAVGLDTVRLSSSADLGTILTNSSGKTLYTFANDEPGWSNCVNDCATTWPPLTVANAESLFIPEFMQANISVAERADGTFQVTLNDRPLYTFSNDAKPGDTTGQGAGGVWFAAQAARVLNLSGNTELGTFIAGSNGMTVYAFANDPAGVSNCLLDCATTWPPVLVEAGRTPFSAAGITQPLGLIDRGDGTFHVTLGDKPLYYFSRDIKPGDATGQGAGGVWYVVQLEIPFDPAWVPVTCVVSPLNNGVNLRGGPGTGFDEVAQANIGDSLIVVGQASTENYVWYLLSTGAWIRSDVVNADASCAAVPKVAS